MSERSRQLTIHIDGGSRGNPGPAGAGVVIFDAAGREVLEAGVFLGRATNNVAEYRALLAALEHARSLRADEVLVRSDSELLVRQMNGEYRVRNEALGVLYAKAFELGEAFRRCRFEHVPREQNTRADELANRAMDLRKSFHRIVPDEPAKPRTRASRSAGKPAPSADPDPATPAPAVLPLLLCQYDVAWEDRPANFRTVRRLLADAEVPADAVIVLPEMFSTGFSMNAAAVAEPPGGPAEQFLADLARERRATVIGGVATARPGDKPLNQAVTFGPDGRELARFGKLHPFRFAGEHAHYSAGDGVVVFDVGGLKVSPFVCYDLRFPEAFRAAARAGAELMLVLANWPAERAEHWNALLRARAIENLAFVAGVNRVGASPDHEYRGGSVVFDPKGRTLAEVGDAERVLRADLDVAVLREYRRQFPALDDIRPDLSGGAPLL